MNAAYFCEGAYRRILARAQSLGYKICTFKTFTRTEGGPVLLLRHDLDHSIRCAAKIARMEAELGIQSTYFVQVACSFYNLLSEESRTFIRELTSLGHEVGLHYDGRRYARNGQERLTLERTLLEEVSGQRCMSASQHVPIASPEADLQGCFENEAYERRFIAAPMQYISDSLLRWRQATPDELLDQGASFQFLAHPENWCAPEPLPSFEAALDLALAEEISALQQGYEDVKQTYRELLDNREQLDRQFAANRGLTVTR